MYVVGRTRSTYSHCQSQYLIATLASLDRYTKHHVRSQIVHCCQSSDTERLTWRSVCSLCDLITFTKHLQHL